MAFSSSYKTFRSNELSLDDLCIKNAPATYIFRIQNSNEISSEFRDGDLVIVDKSVRVKNNSLVVVNKDGEVKLSKVLISNGSIYLVGNNSYSKPIPFREDDYNYIWGIVTYIFRKTY